MAAGDKIKVLLVDDIPETRENIRKLLQFESDIEVVGAVGTGRAGIDASKELKPDVVLMDINLPDMDGITATEQIRRANPAIQIVILSVQGDPNYMRKAMLAGARDYLVKPPSGDDLTAALRRAGKMSQDERLKASTGAAVSAHGRGASLAPAATLGKVIVVYSPKGGGGATTLAVNLAVTLHNEETKVALIDGNLQFGDVAVFLNLQTKNSVLDLATRASELDPEIVSEVMTTHTATGVKILAAPSRPEFAENVTGEQFGKVLEFLRQMFSYIIVDTSSTLTDVIITSMDHSDLVILITTQDIPSIKDARLYLDLADVMKIERRRVLFVMNRFDKRIGILPEKISESFKHEISAVIPFDDRVIVPAINRGVPFMLGNRSLPIAKSVLTLAEVVRQRITEFAAAEAGNVVASLRR